MSVTAVTSIALLSFFAGAVSQLLIGAASRRRMRKRHRARINLIREHYDHRYQALLTRREREMAQAKRVTLPRDDAGPPAVVRSLKVHRGSLTR